MSLVTSLAANNFDLQTNLVKNGVIWSLLLFLFDYDYTLDESGVVTEEKSNHQKTANNLARLSILSTVALAGYDLKLVLDPKDPINAAIKSMNTNKKDDAVTQASPQAQAYTSNAQNVIQNNSAHVAQNNSDKSSNLRSYVNSNDKVSSSEEALEAEPVEKENSTSNKKYTITGQAKNLVVKQIIDHLLTKFIADKFATHSDAEVSHLFHSLNSFEHIRLYNAHRGRSSLFAGIKDANIKHPQSICNMGECDACSTH